MTLTSELENYCHLDNTEIGEYATMLIDLTHHYSQMSDVFQESVIKELEDMLDYYKTSCIIKEIEETTTVKRKILIYDEN